MDLLDRSTLIIVGLVVVLSRQILTAAITGLKHLGKYLAKRFVVSLDIVNRDDSHRWLTYWLSKHPDSEAFRHLSIASSNRSPDDSPKSDRIIRNKPYVVLFPALGTHVVRYQGKFLWITRSREKSQNSASPMETITLRMFGKDPTLLRQVMKEALELAYQNDDGKTVIYGYNTRRPKTEWRRLVSRLRRPLSSVVLDSEISESLVGDVQNFISSGSTYAERGIPYRRGYLLYGPPGCGKTSFVLGLAGELNMNVCFVSFSSGQMNDEVLNELFLDAPQGCIMLLEDVDAAFVERDGKNDNGVTFSGLLNAIDGAVAQEGQILFMTTNHIEKLDPALIRPGRVDVKVLVDLATKDQARQMFDRFFHLPELSEAFSEKIPDRVLSTALIQSHLLQYQNNPEGAVLEASQLFRHLYSFISKKESGAGEEKLNLEKVVDQKRISHQSDIDLPITIEEYKEKQVIPVV